MFRYLRLVAAQKALIAFSGFPAFVGFAPVLEGQCTNSDTVATRSPAFVTLLDSLWTHPGHARLLPAPIEDVAAFSLLALDGGTDEGTSDRRAPAFGTGVGWPRRNPPWLAPDNADPNICSALPE